MSDPVAVPLLILGGNGRIGRAMRGQEAVFRQVGLAPVWQSRRPDAGFLSWDILTEPCPKGAARGVVLCLAGVINGSPEALALNEALAMAACKAAAEQGARHVFLASSAAVYGPSSGVLDEAAETRPPGAYGAAKLAMERAALDWQAEGGPGLTILRIGNIAGFDALLGGHQAGVAVGLDPVEGQEGGPVRSYIGPVSLAVVLARLAGLAAAGHPLPKVLNVAASPPVSMAELLDAAGIDWQFRAPNPAVIARVELETSLLHELIDTGPAAGQAAAMVAEWQGLAK
jgi:nucleoside-diphosphate-sugar epimerase